MITASKRWAIVFGALVVGVAIVTGAVVSRSPGLDAVSTAASTSPARPAPGASPQAAGTPIDPPSAAPAPVSHVAEATAPLAVPAAVPPAGPLSAALPAQAPSVVARVVAGSPPSGPHFDIVRVEPNGDTVLAGQGAPNSTVDLVVSGRVIAQAPTDAGGHFVMIPPALKPGDYALTLRQPVEGRMQGSAQSVTVSVPEKGQGQVVVALAEPGRPTALLSSPPTAPAPQDSMRASAQSAAQDLHTNGADGSKTGGPPLAIRSVELENGNGFFASGVATPGTRLRLYLNNSRLADVVAGPDNGWSVKIRKGLSGGHYVVRADATRDGTHVGARVEVPFDVPVVMAEAVPLAGKASVQLDHAAISPAAINREPSPERPGTAVARVFASNLPASNLPASGTSAPNEGDRRASEGPATDAVIDEVRTTVVRNGDNLWDISRVRLGQGWRYTRIYAANLSQIRNPSLIYPGQVFVLPSENN